MHRPPLRNAQGGFSLADLLAAVAIVAVLLVLLGPVFSTVRGQMAQARCMANLRQIGAGLALYAQDHGVYPYHITGSTRWFDGSNDPASFFAGPYIGATARNQRSTQAPTPTAKGGLFDCPALDAEAKQGLGPETWVADFFDYGQNFSLCGRTPASIQHPGQTIAVVEGGHFSRIKAERTKGLTYTPTEALNPGGTAWNTEPSILRTPHNGLANFLFLDGRVSRHAPRDLSENWFFHR